MLIGELSRRSGVSVRMLRHYDRIGLVSPSARSGAGYREYDAEDVRRLFQAEALRTLGLSLGQAAAALDDPGFDAAEVIAGLRRDAEDRIARDRALLERLQGIEAATPESWEGVLDVVGLLSALRSGTPRDRQAAALRSGSDAPRIVAQLVDAYLAEAEPNAAGALRWAIVRAGDSAVAQLVARVRDPDVRVRRRAVRALAALEGAEAAAALAECLADGDAEVADLAALALAAAGREAERSPRVQRAVTARLVAMIVAGSRDVEAAEALGALSARSAAAEGEIVRLLADGLHGSAASEPGARSRLVQALGEIPGEAALAVLRERLADPDPAVVRVARYLVDRER
ncbi:MerR family transcriptional regulator [Leucobacter celer]|uniref:MerR family transcriptional regulator n=1 Tax=Leucobacter celer TaxID=668625 RepID=UPI0006A79E02|nr:MerR family DNA-binding transcriptional regulator [Leucobacter celer]